MPFIAIVIAIASCAVMCLVSHMEGKLAGAKALCSTQFQGEMRDGKCVRVQTEILVIEPKS